MDFELSFCFVDPAARSGDPSARALLTPSRATAGAAGFDLVAANSEVLELAPGERSLVPTGIAFAIPPGFEGSVRPRSGLALRHGITCLNAPGTIDSDYRGEVGVILANFGAASFRVERGMRIAQIVFNPVALPQMVPVDALPESGRGDGGFGSTGGMGTKNETDKPLFAPKMQTNA